MVGTLSLEDQAIAEWLETDVPIDDIAKKYDLKRLEFSIKGYFKRFVNAAEAYCADTTGDLTHRSAAQGEGLELWMYELFLSKFRVDRSGSKEGQERVAALKTHPLYQSI